jgi:gamma-glutamyl-gamma-aminobutyrate hydrolase PuuD
VGSNGSRPAPGAGHPLIGLTAYGERASYGVWNHDVVLLPGSYVDMVAAAGGVPVLLPPRAQAVAAADRLDGVLLSGGPDLAADLYGADPHPRAGSPRRGRDAAELAVAARALELGLPVLGVCRGAQVLNVALGGTLVQHLPDVVGHDGHNPSPGVFGPVSVTLDPGSRVAAAVGDRVEVRCHHHQAVARPADGLVVTGRAADGTIEAIEHPGRPFVLGVQWHPEQDAADLRLVAGLVAAARRPR